MNRTRGRISITRPVQPLTPAEIVRLAAPEVSVPGDDDAADRFGEGWRLGALVAGLIASALGFAAMVAGLVDALARIEGATR